MSGTRRFTPLRARSGNQRRTPGTKAAASRSLALASRGWVLRAFLGAGLVAAVGLIVFLVVAGASAKRGNTDLATDTGNLLPAAGRARAGTPTRPGTPAAGFSRPGAAPPSQLDSRRGPKPAPAQGARALHAEIGRAAGLEGEDRARAIFALMDAVEAGLRSGALDAATLLREIAAGDADVRQALVRALDEVAPAGAEVPHLLEVARDASSSPHVREAALRHLGALRTGAPPALSAALVEVARAGGDDAVALAAVDALARTGRTGLHELASSDAPVHVRARAVEGLDLADADAEEARQVGRLLGADRDLAVRHAAAVALGRAAGASRGAAIEVLEDACRREPEAAVRLALVASLARAGRARACPALRALAADPDPLVAHSARELAAALEAGDVDLTRIACPQMNGPHLNGPEGESR